MNHQFRVFANGRYIPLKTDTGIITLDSEGTLWVCEFKGQSKPFKEVHGDYLIERHIGRTDGFGKPVFENDVVHDEFFMLRVKWIEDKFMYGLQEFRFVDGPYKNNINEYDYLIDSADFSYYVQDHIHNHDV